MRDVIRLIDNAIDDYETSADAMRCRPDTGERGAPPKAESILSFAEWYTGLILEAFLGLGSALPEASRVISLAGMQCTAYASNTAGPPMSVNPATRTPRRGHHLSVVLIDEAACERINLTALAARSPTPSAVPPGEAGAHAVTPRASAYRDNRPRWQSPYGPPRRVAHRG